MLKASTHLLSLDEFEVVEFNEDAQRKLCRLVVVPRLSVGLCPQCHKATNHRHQTRERRIHDLPWGPYATELVVRVSQYQCDACPGTPVFTPRFSALAESTHATERFLERLAQMVRFSDIQNASAFFGVPEKTLEGWYYDYVERKRSATVSESPIRSLGIDELSRKKRGGDTAAC